MKAQQKKIIIISSVVGFVALVVGLVIYFSKKKQVASSIPSSFSEVDPSRFPLVHGSSGVYVEILQHWLKIKGEDLSVYGVDGKFGDETENALKIVTNKNSVSYADFEQILTDYLSSI